MNFKIPLIVIFFISIFTSCKKNIDNNGNQAPDLGLVKIKLSTNGKVATLFRNVNLIHEKIFDGSNIRSVYLKEGLLDTSTLNTSIFPNIQNDFSLMVGIINDVPELNSITTFDFNKLFHELYADYLNTSQAEPEFRTFGKCEEIRDLQRHDCDFNYGVTYIGCLATGALSGPFVGPVTVICVSAATTIAFNCYSSADKAYKICIR